MKYLSGKNYQKLLILLFVCALFVPLVKMAFSPLEKWSEVEKRALATPPVLPSNHLEISRFFKETDHFFNDHFGFREFLVGEYNRVLESLFDQVAPTSRVIKGLDGWYFFSAFKLLEDFRGEIPLSEENLAEWARIEKERYRWLEARGIRYLLVVVPNKQSVYPEKLMKYALAAKGESRFEQMKRLKGDDLAPFLLDLYPQMIEAKKERKLYFRHDSHWNAGGVKVAYDQIVGRLKELFPALSFREDFVFGEDQTGVGGNLGLGGDLAKSMMKHNEMKDTYPVIREFDRCARLHDFPVDQLTDIDDHFSRRSFAEGCRNKKLKALVFRDSFTVQLAWFLSENFSEIVYLWKEYDQRNVEEVLQYFVPDIVIDIRVERHLFDTVAPVLPKRKSDPAAKPLRQTAEER